ncbi:hypothetical protein L218DRAFT_998575 [Marasmius fiardii PR-910]|nr:hypothetical protein L218DRAFT_998575 [Marasmius fiardii PR-910]
MASNNFELTAEDRELWRRRAPRAGYWLRVNDTHPVANPEEPQPQLRLPTPSAPPTPPTPPAPPAPPILPAQHHQPQLAAPQPQLPLFPPPPYPNIYPQPIYPFLQQAPSAQQNQGYPSVPHYPPPPYQGFYNSPIHYQPHTFSYPPPVAHNSMPPPLPPSCITQFTISVPLYTGVSGGGRVREQLRISVDTPFDTMYNRICTKMDIDSAHAELGWKVTGEPARNTPHKLSSAVDYQAATAEVIGKNSRARSKIYFLEIYNLKRPQVSATHAKTGGRKRRYDDPDEPTTTVGYGRELLMLDEHLRCSKHPGQYCRVDPVSGEHIQLNAYERSLWAKEIHIGRADHHKPPNALDFDRIRKKACRETQTAAPPAVHVHFNGLEFTSPQAPSPSRIRSPLHDRTVAAVGSSNQVPPSPVAGSTTTGSSIQVIDISDDSDDETSIVYPSIDRLLVNLNAIHPTSRFTQYSSDFIARGIKTVDALVNVSPPFFTEYVRMPTEDAALLVDAAAAWVTIAKQRKGGIHDNAKTPKQEKEN